MFAQKAMAAAVSTVPVYVEDVMSSYLYTGTGATQTITNGVDLSSFGGLVWTKPRNTSSTSNSHILTDTARGAYYQLITNSTGAQYYPGGAYGIGFTTSGFSLVSSDVGSNSSSDIYASWTFRKQAKFFDVVTYTGDGNNPRVFSHSLGSAPGCFIVKATSAADNWFVYHRSLGATKYIVLDSTGAEATNAGPWNNTAPTSTQFTIGSWLNQVGVSYVAYLFAHDAGGFGTSGTDSVISCGSFTTNGSGNVSSVVLGWEPQWVLYKTTDVADNWRVVDNMRGMPVTATTGEPVLKPNTSDAEQANAGAVVPNATGFSINGASPSYTYIYIAIRRGPMKVPTSGTSVYNAIARNGTGAVANVTGVGFAPDLSLSSERGTVFVGDKLFFDKLRGANARLTSTATSAESSSATDMLTAFGMDGVTLGADANWYINKNANPYINWYFRRAPGFFDIVCFTATGSNFSVTHNLGAVPELVITKERNGTRSWYTYAAGAGNTKYLALDGTAAATTGNAWQDTTPTSTTLYLTGGSSFFSMSQTYVAYLFATVAGVSKVGSYTGSGTTKQIDCGFTGGARFVLIKRADSTGDWYVWDSARGIIAGNDPYLLLNSTADEVTSTDYIDTYSAGFELSSTAPAAINASGGTFIYLAIA